MDVFSPSECLLRQLFRYSHRRSCPKSDEKETKNRKRKNQQRQKETKLTHQLCLCFQNSK